MPTVLKSEALEQVVGLLESPPERPLVEEGYLDLLGDAPPLQTSISQRLMESRALPLIYERLWRPVGFTLAKGVAGPDTAEEARMARELLALREGERVLDVACGPGNVTRRLQPRVGEEGLVVGIDASATMLAQAVQEPNAPNIAYVRGDAEHLPFARETFDAVACFGAMYLFREPYTALTGMAHALRPGGRLAILTSCHRGPELLHPVASLAVAPSGVRVFTRQEIPAALRALDFHRIRQHVSGVMQFIGAVKDSP